MLYVVLVQSLGRVQLCDPMDCITGFLVLHCPKVCSNSCPLNQPWLDDSGWMPSNHLIPCHPLLLLPSVFLSIRVFSSESALCIRWPNYWSFSFSISLSNEYSGLISLTINWFDLLTVQGTLGQQASKHRSLTLSFLYGPTLTPVHGYWKNHSSDYTDVCRQNDVSAF